MSTPTAGPDDRSPTLSDERVAELEVVMTSIVDIVEHDAAMPSMANDARAMVAEIFAALRSAQRRCVSEAFDDARIAAIEARAEADGSADPFGHINALMADIPVLLSALRSARRELDEANAKIAVLSEPDICGRGDYTYYEQDGWDADDCYPNKVYPLDWANRTIPGDWHLARIVTDWEEGDVVEDEMRLFPTKQAALDAVAASEALRSSPPILEKNDRG